MNNIFKIVLILNLFSIISSVLLSYYSYKQIKNNRTAGIFCVLMSIFAFWGFSNTFLMFTESLALHIFVFQITRAVTIFTPLLIFLVVIDYTNIPAWFNSKHKIALIILTGIISLLALTDYFHQFFTVNYQLITKYEIPFLDFKAKRISILFFIQIYAFLLLSVSILIISLFQSNNYFRKQVVYILIGVSLPAINDIFYWYGFSLIPGYHLITVSFAVGNLFLAYSVLGYKFLKIAPVTRILVVDSIEDIVITLDKYDNILDMNKSCEVFFDVNYQQEISKPFYDVFSSFPDFISFYKNQNTDIKELTITRKHKKYHFSVKIARAVIQNRNKIAIIIVLHNITEIKEASNEIEEREKKLATIFNTTFSGVALIGADGNYMSVNPRYEELTGYTLGELKQQPVGKLTHPDDLEKIRSALQKIGKRQLFNHVLEMRIITKQNCIKWMHTVANEYYDINNKFQYVLVEFFDITERKNAEMDLKKYTKELERSNATKDKFFSIIAHDLRNPFNGLIGASNLLLDNYKSYSTDNVVSMLEIIRDSSKTGYSLLENLLEWSRLQTNTIAFTPNIFSLNDLIQGVISALSISALNKEIKITYLHQIKISIFADYNMVYSAFSNILTNAIKFSRLKSEIIIRNGFFDPSEEFAIISVADSGVGINKENLDKLFRIDNKISTKGTSNESGTGLGLVLCKEFIEKNGGRIWVESTVGIGTKVSFTLRVHQQTPESNVADNNLKGTEVVPDNNSGEIEKGIKYQLPNLQTPRLVESLISLLKIDKIYLDSDIKLTDVAKRLNTNREYLRQIIKDTFNTNFIDLINEYRVKESIMLLKDQKKSYSPDSIGMASGFKSKSEFFQAFRKYTNQTPEEFVNQSDKQ